MSTSFYSKEELKDLGLGYCGNNVLLSKKTSIYGAKSIHIGDNSRIDDFSLLSGKIEIGKYTHVGAYSALFGALGIVMEDFATLSPRVTIFSASDDFGGDYLVGPQILKEEFKHVFGGPVILKKHANIGSGCIILPNVTLEEGAAVGSMSLVTKSLPAWTISIGRPAKPLRERSKGLLKMTQQLPFVNTISGWMSRAELDWLRKRAESCNVIIEIGTWLGRSSYEMGQVVQGKVYTIDPFTPWEVFPDKWPKSMWQVRRGTIKDKEYLYKECCSNLNELIQSGKVEVLRGYSEDVLVGLQQLSGSVDMVFIDGNHSYLSVKQDIINYLPLICTGGIICGHDFGQDVMRAVLEVLPETKEVPGTTIWFCEVR